MSVALTRNQLTSELKTQLRKTVRALRESLITQLKESAEQRYLLNVPTTKAASSLSNEALERRRRLDAALDQAAQEDGGGKEARARAFDSAAKEAGATLLNRLVVIRHLEALGLSKPEVLTGGWMSKGYQEFQRVAGALCEDETQGMAPLLELLFAELAVALPGLFGDVGLTGLLSVPPATLRHVIEALDEVPGEAWRDDLTLGWVYQYWNDPDREALDAKISGGGKIEAHEIASKTQMFTERYMVEWLLQNSLGPTWLAICRKNGWVAEAESMGLLGELDARRAEWRKRREAGDVAPDALMPISGALEEAWKYYVPQPMPAAVVEHAPVSIRDLKLLDPACGSGHFLVVAFDLLVELYREESRHRGETWADKQIAEWILENNLHGIDIDARAVQIAAAAVYLKARALAKDVDPRQVNLVAPLLKLSVLAKDDPGLLRLETDIQKETGIPPALTRQLIAVLEGVDYLGTLLKVGDAIDKALVAHEGEFTRQSGQSDLFNASRAPDAKPLSRNVAKKIVQQRLEGFLANHSGAEDLGLRLRGQQLTAGLRFSSIAKEGEYHLVVGNPPYQGTSKMKNAGYVAKNYPMGKADLYAAFLERGLQLCRTGGASAMVTMRSWMFLSGYTALREHLLKTFDLRILGDVDRGAFEEVPDEVVATTMSIFRRGPASREPSVAMQPSPLSDKTRDSGRTSRKRAALFAQVGRFEFSLNSLVSVPGKPLVYWWGDAFIRRYGALPKLGETAEMCKGLSTCNDTRFLRLWWEPARAHVDARRFPDEVRPTGSWVPYMTGGGFNWVHPLREVVRWKDAGLEIATFSRSRYGRGASKYFRRGVAFSMIGNSFAARVHRFASVIGDKGASVFADDVATTVCVMNSSLGRHVLESLNPSISFNVADVHRLPLFPMPHAQAVWSRVEAEFARYEAARESSIEFIGPGSSNWDSTQAWAQAAIDIDAVVPLPDLALAAANPSAEALLSFEVGVALGRFDRRGGVLLGSASGPPLRDGILFLAPSERDSLASAATLQLRECSKTVARPLRDYLMTAFWPLHRETYENRPIFLPLSSAKRTFVAFVAIHTWSPSTLTKLLSDHLIPERKALEGSLSDLRAARASGDKKSRSETDRQFSEQTKWLEELEDFITKVTECAEKGPPPPDASTPAREVNAPYVMNLDDGVMVNAAALWPLLETMWKEPRKWWKELASAKGRKDYDWSHLSARYFPSRVDEKCQGDPSLAVAHGCFWKHHPEAAYQWELRLQDEIGPDFRINEKDSDALRKAFLSKNQKRATELKAAEEARRQRKANKQDQDELALESNEDADERAEAE